MQDFVSSIFDFDLHAKRVASLADAVVGALTGARLAVGALGRALAVAKDLGAKHAIKQVDRLFSNTGVDVWRLFASWAPFVVGSRPEIVAALDWTDYDKDNQSTIALHHVTRHGRATPLLWKTVMKSKMKGWRNEHEDELLEDQLGFDFIIRFRGVVGVIDEHGVTQAANDWGPKNGRPCLLRKARVTKYQRQIGGVVCVKAKGMKEPWCLATSREDLTGAAVVKLYGKRFTIESAQTQS